MACSALPESKTGHRIAAAREMLMQVPRGSPGEDTSLVSPKISCCLNEDRLFQKVRFSLCTWQRHSGIFTAKQGMLTGDNCQRLSPGCTCWAVHSWHGVVQPSGKQWLPASRALDQYTGKSVVPVHSTKAAIANLTCACCWLTSALVGATNTTRPPCCMTWLHT